ncbi:Alkaline protease secretion ATP-binding protein AprD [uncultured Gammaproteobacteria bacterium]
MASSSRTQNKSAGKGSEWKKLFWGIFSGCLPDLAVVGIFSFATNVLMLIVPIYTLQLYDRVLSSYHAETLLMLTVLLVVGLLFMSLLDAVRARLIHLIATKFDIHLAEGILACQVELASQHLQRRNAQGLRDLASIKNCLAARDILNFFDMPWVVIHTAIIFMFSAQLGMMVLVGAVLMILLAVVNEWTTTRMLGDVSAESISVLEQAEAITRNSEAILAMGMLTPLLQRWGKLNAELRMKNDWVNGQATVIEAVSRFLRILFQTLTLTLGAWLVINDTITSGSMYVGSLLTSRALAPVEGAIRLWRNIKMSQIAYQRITALFDQNPPKPVPMPLPRPSGQLTVERLIYGPPGAAEPVVSGVTFQVAPGEALGVIGPSACGKSTLLKLILGIWRPNSGYVRLDGADVAEWHSDDLGAYVGYLPQEIDFIPGTVRENIARFKEATPDEIIKAARMAGVHDLILHLPHGYETQIGQGGYVLTGGQRQRLALARALFGHPALLVLDEPNSNLDGEGEAALLAAIARAKAERITTLMVAHRPSILGGVDRILIMRDGKVERIGPTSEIIKTHTPSSTTARPPAPALEAKRS